MTAPSGWTIQNVMSIATSLASRLEADGVATDEADLLAYLRDGGADVETLLLRLARAAVEARDDADKVGARMAVLSARKARYTRRCEEYRSAIQAIMDALGMHKHKHAEFTLTISAGRPGIVVRDVEMLPAHLVRVTKAPAMDEIKAALARGEDVPGVEPTNGAPSLTIRSA